MQETYPAEVTKPNDTVSATVRQCKPVVGL